MPRRTTASTLEAMNPEVITNLDQFLATLTWEFGPGSRQKVPKDLHDLQACETF